MRPLSALLATMALVAAAGCLGAETDDPASKAFTEQNSWALDPGGYGEANVELVEGATLTAQYASDGGAVRWDVHGHDAEGNVETLDSGIGEGGTITFTAPTDGAYSVLWENPTTNAAVILTATVKGTGSFDSFAP